MSSRTAANEIGVRPHRRSNEDLEDPARGARRRGVRRECMGATDDAAHLHRRAAAAGRHAQDRGRVSEAQPEREGRRRSRRRDVGSAAAVPVHGALVEGRDARSDPDRRDSSSAMGRTGLGRAARCVSWRGQGESTADLSQGLFGGEPGRRQADRAAVFRRRAVPVLPQGSARQVQASGPEDLGRVDGDGEAHPRRREEFEPAGLLDGGRADRRHGLHVSRAAVGDGRRAHEGRQAEPRHAASAPAVPALRTVEAGRRAAEEHRRDPDRSHPYRLPGRERHLRAELGLLLEPRRE